MKLKYKKIIMLTAMSTMGIGLLTLSVSQDRPKAEESLSTGARLEATLLDADTDSDINTLSSEIATEPSVLPTSQPTPTLAPTPTALPVYEIEEGTYPKIDKLIEQYYATKNTRDIDKMKSLLSDPTKVETLEELQKKTEYIEDYLNIKTYSKKGVEDGTYIVYVYQEIKFTSINTPAPSLAKFYVITGEDKKLKIFSGELTDEMKAYYDARDTDEDVNKLIEMTNKQSKKAMEKDEDLLNFWKSIDEMANNNQEATKAEGDSAE